MSAVDEIEAAIVKLTGLRASVSPSTYAAMTYYASGEGGYADLSVLLFRTIDAQLAILEKDLQLYDQFSFAGEIGKWVSAVERAGDLDLARAINGTA